MQTNNMASVFKLQKPLYSKLSQVDAISPPKWRSLPLSRTIAICAGIWLLSVSLAAIGGFKFASYGHTDTPLGPVQVSSQIRQTYQYNRTFAEPPSVATDQAWDEMFPLYGGFFQHPKFAPQRSGLAVFHQLHCLNGIRQGYWSMKESRNHERAESHQHVPDPHIRHCIDYLRQSLMCHTDTNIEPVIEDLHGVKGFGTEHQCRDFNRAKEWVTEWEDFHQ